MARARPYKGAMSTQDIADGASTSPLQEVTDKFARMVRERPPEEQALIEQAFDAARVAHAGQQRRSGEPYISHPVAVAQILHELQLDCEALSAALLHDVIEDTAVDVAQLRADFGDTVAMLVEGVTKMEVIDEYSETARGGAGERQQVERLKKLLLAMATDVRVVLIKLADRLHNMRTLRHLDAPARQRIARETLEIYAPLASRLGDRAVQMGNGRFGDS